MGIENPIGDKKTDLYERYRIDQIEYDRRDREEKAPKKFSEKTPFFALGFLRGLYKKVMSILTSDTKINCENLYAIRGVLRVMQAEDRSQDPQLLTDFSYLWEKIYADMVTFRKKSAEYTLFHQWFSKIDSYPEGQEYSLGYYLSKQAGVKWLPFPYMEMIHRLHTQHQKNPTHSVLAEWVSSLEKLIDLLQHE